MERKTWNKIGTVCGTLSKDEIEKLIIGTDNKELKKKLLRFLEWARPELVVSEPYEEVKE